jgi:hypothetical protein
LIKIGAQFFFIQAQILQAILFNSCISIHNVLLPNRSPRSNAMPSVSRC